MKYLKFDSLNELEAYINDNKPLTSLQSSAAIGNYQTKWTGTKNLPDALDLMMKGDGALLASLKNNAKNFKINSERSSGIELYRSQVGFIPNMGAIMTGHPMNMFNVRQTLKVPKKVLNIIYDICAPFSVSSETIQKQAGKLLNYIDKKEAEGYKINLYSAVVAAQKNNQDYCILAKIKNSDEHFDPLRVAFPLCHASFFRRILFAVYERQNLWEQYPNYGTAYRLDHGNDKAAKVVNTILPNFQYFNMSTIDNV